MFAISAHHDRVSIQLENGSLPLEYHPICGTAFAELVRQANADGYDAVVIACFADAALEAAKEISDIPVYGIEETSMHIAAMLGHKFGFTTMSAKRVSTRDMHVRKHGLETAYGSTLVMNMSVLEMDANPEQAKARIVELAGKAVEDKGIEVVILGCASLVGYAADIERELGVFVLDPTAVTFKVAEALCDLGLRHSKLARFAHPPERDIR